MRIIILAIMMSGTLFGCSSLTETPQEIRGLWYMDALSKDCDFCKDEKACAIEISAASVEEIDMPSWVSYSHRAWRESTDGSVVKARSEIKRKTTVISADDKWSFSNNELKSDKARRPEFKLDGDKLLVVGGVNRREVITYRKALQKCDEAYTKEKRADYEKSSKKQAEAKAKAAARKKAEANSPNCAKYVDCTCGLNTSLIAYYEKMGVDLPASAKKSVGRSCDAAKKLMKTAASLNPKGTDKACKQTLRSLKKGFKIYSQMGIDVPSACE
jgi:hypothetical protein